MPKYILYSKNQNNKYSRYFLDLFAYKMSSDKKLATEEQLLLKDVFLIKIYQDNLTDYSGYHSL